LPEGLGDRLPPARCAGSAFKVLSVSIFTLMAVCIKAAAPGVPPGEAVFFRSFFAIP
jgi:hypothetical protein